MDITFENLSYSYPAQKGQSALCSLNGVIKPGIHLLLGENGAGKTTLLHIIAGLRFATGGRCLIDGAEARLRLPSILSKVAFLGDNMGFPASTIWQTAATHAPFYPGFDRELLERLLATFGLTGHEKLRELSLGNRHKSQLAYMIALRTEILLLDEPANGLDIESRQLLQRIVAENVSPEQTVIVSTHTFADLRNLYDGVMILSHGRLLLASAIEQILSRVTFGVAVTPPPGSLYFEPRLGRVSYIAPRTADNGDESDIDYLLLYNAVKSGTAQSLQDILDNLQNQTI